MLLADMILPRVSCRAGCLFLKRHCNELPISTRYESKIYKHNNINNIIRPVKTRSFNLRLVPNLERSSSRDQFLRSVYHFSRTYSALYKRSLLMCQFEKIKKQYPGYILLFQVGDFYELYGDDASEVASKTSLRLTKKNNIFMAGFPTKSLSEWQRTLVEAGFQLAICDQTIPKESGKIRLLDREVVKLITPGTLVEPLTCHANYLLCLVPGPSSVIGLSWVDVSTAEFQVTTSEIDTIDEDIERISPSEVLLPEDVVSLIKHGQVLHPSNPSLSASLEGLVKCSLLKDCNLTSISPSYYSESISSDSDQTTIKKKISEEYLNGQSLSKLEYIAASVLLQFVVYTQRSVLPHLSPPIRYSYQQHMAIDANTRRALEIVIPLHNNTKKCTLLGCIDRTVTAAGGRLLKSRISSPLMNIDMIERRLDVVELFCTEAFHCEIILSMLKRCDDLERILQKVSINIANISDLLAIKTTLSIAAELMNYIEKYLPKRSALDQDMEGCHVFSDLVEELENALCGTTHGDYITTGYSDQIDFIRNKIQNNSSLVNGLIESLLFKHSYLPKLSLVPHKGYNRVFEVNKSQTQLAERCPDLIRVDHTQSKTRFSNMELQRLNAEKQSLESLYVDVQSQLFKTLCEKVMKEADKIKSTAQALARLDVSSSLGAVANEKAYSKPIIRSTPGFSVIEGFHPVVSSMQQSTFVRNDCDMSEHGLWIVTGPNMGGKSTFLRQNAVIAILAQMGSFVPARRVEIGVIDRLFARVGASDNVARHMSTFHMEMTETANILTNATSQSFVILDEIGRGTGTAEGLSIAQAVVEHIHSKIGCRSLVATHFHQLSGLADHYKQIGCYKSVVNKDGDDIIFTYNIKPGFVQHSFAIDVAQLAGIPKDVVDRAKELLLSS